MKLFSTKLHGMMDYSSTVLFFTLPRVLGWGEGPKRLFTGITLGKLIYSPLTRYELGLVKVLPVKAHLGLDALLGVLFGAAPFLFPDEERSTKAWLLSLNFAPFQSNRETKKR